MFVVREGALVLERHRWKLQHCHQCSGMSFRLRGRAGISTRLEDSRDGAGDYDGACGGFDSHECAIANRQ